MPDFVLEIGTEEIPAGMIRGLYEELARRVDEGLRAAGLDFEAVEPGGAPRRIGFVVRGLPARQADRVETVAGPAMAIARDAEGRWTKAAEGFARKQGADLSLLREVAGPKGPCVGFEREVPGRATAEILAEVVPAAADALYLPKTMRWGDGSQAFVRPVRWVLALLDGDVVPMRVKGAEAGRTTRGHRFHGAASAEVASAGAYFEVLRRERVLADPEERRQKILSELAAEAARLGGHVGEDPELAERLVYLCEYPTVLSGEIPAEFLSLPTEVLVTCLREHQNFFVVRDAAGAAMPHFLAVMDSPADPRGLVRKGLENVSRSRLADAHFFYEHDVKVPLEDRLEELRGIVFHPKLGSYRDKVLRVEALARALAEAWGADAEAAAWAGRHCKADLASLLVQEKEFTSLQGIAGGLCARAQGRPEAAWMAIYDHYRPLFAEDDLPRGAVGAAVAAADKLDTLREMFRIGQAPTGSKDPFALRRAASGVVRILAEHPHTGDLDLTAFLAAGGPAPEGLAEFLAGRLRYLWEERGYPYDEINAALGFGLSSPRGLTARLEALHAVRKQFPDDFDHLAVAFKRAKNILKGLPEYPLDAALFLPAGDKEGDGERALFEAVEAVRQEAEASFEAGAFADGLRRLAAVRPAVDRFFDDVLVMCDPEGRDPEKTARQRNRLALLQRLVALFDRVADFSLIVPRQEK